MVLGVTMRKSSRASATIQDKGVEKEVELTMAYTRKPRPAFKDGEELDYDVMGRIHYSHKTLGIHLFHITQT